MINVISPIFGISGYDIHGRELANALSKLTETRITTPFMPNWEKVVTDKELEMLKKIPDKDEWDLIISTPTFWKMYLGKKNMAYCIFEGDRVPEGWIKEMLNPEISYILVASHHTKEAIENTLTDSCNMELIRQKIKVIPHGVDLNKFYSKSKIPLETFKYTELNIK